MTPLIEWKPLPVAVCIYFYDCYGYSETIYGSSLLTYPSIPRGFPGSSDGKESTCNAGDPSSIPGSGRSSGEGIGYLLQYSWASLVTQMVKNSSAMRVTWIRSLGWEAPLERGWQPTPVFLPGESPWTEETGGLQSVGSQRVGQD